jgi:hypothetical protein
MSLRLPIAILAAPSLTSGDCVVGPYDGQPCPFGTLFTAARTTMFSLATYTTLVGSIPAIFRYSINKPSSPQCRSRAVAEGNFTDQIRARLCGAARPDAEADVYW